MPSYTSLLLIISLLGCGLLGSDPKEPEPGRRDYIWEVDTLFSPPGGFVYDIWGSSPNDVWAVLGTGVNNLWHYDGNEWRVWPKRVAASFYSLYGLAQDDVWMGSSDGKIFHFDGEEWTLSYEFEKTGLYTSSITEIWGESVSNVYAVGTFYMAEQSIAQGFILHFDGEKWSEVLTTDFEIQPVRMRGSKKNVFIVGYNYPDMFFFQLEKNALKKVYSTSTNDEPGISLNRIGNTIYFVIGDGLLTLENKEFKEWLAISNSNFGYQIYGRNEADVFLRMNDGLAHYNGEDIGYLFDLNSPLLSLSNNAMLFEKEVFFIVNDFDLGTNYVYHGTLTE